MTMLLVTIPFSHFSEKARWGLAYAGLPFTEEAHLPFFARRTLKRIGARHTVPALVSDEDGRVLPDSSDILQFCDRRAPIGRKLYPAPVASEVAALEDELDETFGRQVRRVAYALTLHDRRLILSISGDHAPAGERRMLALGFPLVRAILRRYLRIDADTVARSMTRIETTFAGIDARLADGRRFLVGEQFSAADLTFASLGSLLVFPPEHPRWIAREQAPTSMITLCDRLRATRAGAHILRMYREFRAPGASR